MKIMHIMFYREVKSNGVMNVVPLHVISQSKKENVILYNANSKINYHNESFSVRNGDFKNILYEFKPDLVIFHEIYLIKYKKYSEICSKKKIPYVIVPHGSLTVQAQNIKPTKKKIANFLLFNSFIKKASAIHFLSNEEERNSIFKEFSFVIPNGCDQKDNNFYKLNYNKKKLTFIGRISIYHKGLDILMDAIEILKEELIKQNITINLYGPDDKNGYNWLTEYIKTKHLNSIIKLHDGVFDEEKTHVLSQTKYFIQSSRFEGLPLSLLESLSYGIPIIVTKGCNMNDFLKEYNCGFSCDINSIALSKIILKAINLSKVEYESMQKNALQCINDCFSWGNIATKSIDVYKSIISEWSIS